MPGRYLFPICANYVRYWRDMTTQGGGAVKISGYTERLKSNDQRSEVWWDSSPAVYVPYKKHLLEKYPAAFSSIEQLMPDTFAQPGGFSNVTTNPRLVTAVILEKRDYWLSRFNLAQLAPQELRRKLYDEVIVQGDRKSTRLNSSHWE